MVSISFTEKKPKSKKEKPSDPSDGISDLLAQMTLQSSSSANTRPELLLSANSNTDKPEIVILDTPVNHKEQQKDAVVCSGLHDCPKTPLPHAAESEAAASPSVSAVIDALHLSDINWDASSFMSSPQAATNHSTEAVPTTDSEVKESEGENTKQKSLCDVKQAESRSAQEPCYTDCSLRERLLMRNTAKAVNQMEVNNDVVSKQLKYELASLENNQNSKPSGQISSKESSKQSLTDKSQCVTNTLEKETQSSNKQLMPTVQAQNKTKDKANVTRKPPQKYKFVRTASSLALPPQRCHSDPGQSDKKDASVPQTTKKSVCMSVCSSSEDSDAENHQSGPQRPTKTKPTNKIKGGFISDFPLKPVSVPKTTKPSAETAHSLRLIEPKSQSYRMNVANSSTPVSAKDRCLDVPQANALLQSPASPVTVSDSDDSVICSDSPLPLAERLRLKFLK